MANDDSQTSQNPSDARKKGPDTGPDTGSDASLPEPKKSKKRAKPRMFRSIYIGGIVGGLTGIVFVAILAILVVVGMSVDAEQRTGQNAWWLLFGLACPGVLLVIFCSMLGAIAGLVRSRM